MASLRNLENVFQVMIGKNISRAATQINDPSASGYIADGEIVVTDGQGTILTDAATLTTNPVIQLVQRSGATASTAQLIYSKLIKGKDIINITGKAYTAAAEQVTIVGYDGTTGSIDVTADTVFITRMTGRWNNGVYNEHKIQKIYRYEAPGVTPTQINVARALAEDVNNDLTRYCSAVILAPTTSDAAPTGAPTDLRPVQGSKIVPWTGTDPTNFAVGAWLRIGGTTSAFPVYRINAIDTTANTITLNMPYQGASATVLVANVKVITAAAIAGYDCGVKMTGLALAWKLGHIDYEKAFWDTTVSGFGATTVAVPTKAYKGSGVYEQVAEDERFSVILDGAQNVTLAPIEVGRADALSTGTYDCVILSAYDTSDVGHPVSGFKPSKYQLVLWLYDGAAQNTAASTGINTVLAAYGATLPVPISPAAIAA